MYEVSPIAAETDRRHRSERPSTRDRPGKSSPTDIGPKSEALYRACLDTVPEAIALFDERGFVLMVNLAAEAMFGAQAETLVGSGIERLISSPKSEWRTAGSAASALTTGEMPPLGTRSAHGETWETEGRREDGSVFPVSLTLREVSIDGETLFVGILVDLSERKAFEASLLQSQKMEAIGRLAGGVAHDFNTLLGTITGYAELLRDAMAEGTARVTRVQVRQFAEKIHRAARRGANLTGQLLAFSRQQDVQPKLVDLRAMTRETADMIQRLIGEDISFEHAVEERLGKVSMDPGQLQQVLLNLAVNAADAMPKGGRLTLAWTRVDLERETPMHGGTASAGTYAVLEVRDTGCGMDEATLERIFEPFFTTKDEGKGTGLGLSTVFGIVRQWQGSIEVSSLLDEGTTFRIYLPEVEDAGGEARPAASPRPTARDAGRGETVLLVEDDAMFRELVAEVLQTHGYRVLTAESPKAAEPIYRRSLAEIDVLVSDLVMPEGSGLELATAMRSLRPGLRVILMSGYDDVSLVDRDLDETEADEFLHKPFSTGALLDAVRRVLVADE